MGDVCAGGETSSVPRCGWLPSTIVSDFSPTPAPFVRGPRRFKPSCADPESGVTLLQRVEVIFTRRAGGEAPSTFCRGTWSVYECIYEGPGSFAWGIYGRKALRVGAADSCIYSASVITQQDFTFMLLCLDSLLHVSLASIPFSSPSKVPGGPFNQV